MQIYSKNNKNCFFSHISWPIFILFILSDRARWVLQNLLRDAGWALRHWRSCSKCQQMTKWINKLVTSCYSFQHEGYWKWYKIDIVKVHVINKVYKWPPLPPPPHLWPLAFKIQNSYYSMSKSDFTQNLN